MISAGSLVYADSKVKRETFKDFRFIEIKEREIIKSNNMLIFLSKLLNTYYP